MYFYMINKNINKCFILFLFKYTNFGLSTNNYNWMNGEKVDLKGFWPITSKTGIVFDSVSG